MYSPANSILFFEVAAFGVAQIRSGWIGGKEQAAHLVAIGLASITFMVLTATFVLEILYGVIDPRIKATQSD